MPKILFAYMHTIEFFVEGGKPLGGSAVETLVWTKVFRELGYEVQQVRYENDDRKRKAEFDWVELIPIFNSEVTMIRMWYLYRFPSYFKALKKAKSNVLFTSIPTWYSFYISLFCKVLGIKHIIRIPSDEMVDKKIYLTETKLTAFYIRRAFLLADLILAQNEYQYVQLKKAYSKKKIIKVYNPFIIDRTFLKQKDHFEGYIAWVANFRHVKNLGLLSRIAERYPSEYFKIAGAPLFPMDEETDKSLFKLRSLPNVEFVGSVSQADILGFFSKAKYLLNTSRYEGFSNTFIEAMCTGTPILTTNNVNPDGIIQEFDLGGVYADEFDLGRFFEPSVGLSYLNWSRNCLEFVKSNHDHQAIGVKISEILARH
jgi:glycosyltransferase involved in cell wall biosynthesis